MSGTTPRESFAPVSRAELSARRMALATALERGGDRLPDPQVSRARTLEQKASARISMDGTRTVVALAGATGSGKSSLFNALTTEPVSRIGARRPTTSEPAAAIWGDDPSDELLDWLEVGTRHHVPTSAKGAESLDGLVLLDLPDFDSRVLEHRRDADRVLDRADVFVWVTDPQKYADAVMHDEYIRRMAGHAAVTLVVLNQIDRLSRRAVTDCVADLKRLLAKDGIESATVLATSAVRGVGVSELSAQISSAVQANNAAEQRLLADVRASARRLREAVADGEADTAARSDAAAVDAFGRAAGVPVVVDAVARDYRQQAARRAGWPPVRWLRRLRPAAVQRRGLEHLVGGVLSRKETRIALGGSSLPSPTPAAHAAVDVATSGLADEAAAGLPQRWADSVHDAASGSDLYAALDREISGTTIQDRDPSWWLAAWLAQWLLLAVAVAGAVWLLVAAGLSSAGNGAHLPAWGPLPAAGWLLIGGVVLGVLLALLSRWFATRGARARAKVADRRLTRAVSAVVGSQVVSPIEQVLRDHAATRESLERAAG